MFFSIFVSQRLCPICNPNHFKNICGNIWSGVVISKTRIASLEWSNPLATAFERTANWIQSKISSTTPWSTGSTDISFLRQEVTFVAFQEYSRNQFLSLPDARQEKAYHTFVTVDIDTLTRAIQREFNRLDHFIIWLHNLIILVSFVLKFQIHLYLVIHVWFICQQIRIFTQWNSNKTLYCLVLPQFNSVLLSVLCHLIFIM